MDKYDQHIAELTALPEEQQLNRIGSDWLAGRGLFQFLCKEGASNEKESYLRHKDYGCPTMIRAGAVVSSYYKYRAETEALTLAAKNADLPTEASSIRPVHFQTLANLQRQADLELGRE